LDILRLPSIGGLHLWVFFKGMAGKVGEVFQEKNKDDGNSSALAPRFSEKLKFPNRAECGN
jgi:hypothetical protein